MEDIEEIYKQYANLIKKYIFFITKNEDLSEEIMQETFVVAIKQINNFRGECEISTWLYSIAKKILYKKLRKENKNLSIDEIEVSDDKNLEEDYIKKDNKLKLYYALQQLDVKTREVVYLRLTGDLSFKEIGNILNKTESWARTTFFRGKQKLIEKNLL